MKTASLTALLLVLALPVSRPALAQRFAQTNLVSDLAGTALHTDPNLVNPWGLAPSAGGVFWTSNNVSGTSTLYDPDGTPRALIVTIPGGAPTGVVATSATDSAFDIPNGATTARAVFIFVSLGGRISAWSPAVNQTNAVEVASKPGAVYTGVALGNTPVNPRLYAANFAGGTIDVYDTSFVQATTSGTFTDPNLPAGYFPFNIANLGGQLYVMYAQHGTAGSQAGPGLGVVSVFDSEGNFVRRFITGGELNSPWAAVQARPDFGPFGGDVLIGNFGDGRILAYDSATGAFKGALLDTLGNPLVIERVWGLAFGRAASGAEVAQRLYFAAGIGNETHGLFGFLAAAASAPPPPVASCDNNSKGAGFWRKACGGPLNDHGHGHGEGHGGDESRGHGPFDVGSDSLGVLFACITHHAAPNAFGDNGCFTAGCDLLRKVGQRTDTERAAQVLLVTRLNLCSGAVCDSLPIPCADTPAGISVLKLGAVADSLDMLLCQNGHQDDIRRLAALLGCVLDSEDGDERGDDDARSAPTIAVRALGTNPLRLGDGPVRFDVSATSPSMVRLRVYDVRGRLVAEPMHQSMVVGDANVTWDGRDFRGRSVVPGTYFYRAVAGGQAATGRLLIVR